jgi:hypothetical protein
MITIIQATFNQNCNYLAAQNNVIGSDMFCNQVPPYWLNALAWIRNNVGPYGSRVLSWWDYGDWINWFGNSNAALRGDNAEPAYDYATAAHLIFGAKDGFNSTVLAKFLDTSQAKYVLLDDQLVPKWGALDFLGCVSANQTSYDFAIKAGQAQNPPQPFALGTSNCEVTHDPMYLLVPIQPGINDYCSFSNSSNIALRGIGVIGSEPANVSYCVPQSFLYNLTASRLLTPNGTKTNAFIIPYYYGGTALISGEPFASFLVIYAPNGPNDTITDAPTEFYSSNFYQGFFLGKLQGFTIAYPTNFTSGLNFVNSTHKVVILQVNNFTGSLPHVTPKPSWVTNNYSMPG